MRSTAEIAFRARQEAGNLLLAARPPKFSGEMPLDLALPNAGAVSAALGGSDYASSVERIAEMLLAHRLPLLGTEIETGPNIRWRRDYVHGNETGTAYFRRIPYLNFEVSGDHKFIWELNRHQHLVLLAQAFALTGRREFTDEIWSQLESWLEQNPFQRGINWTSALEVAFRALSWILVYHLTAREMPEQLRRQFVTGLYRHGHHLSLNLSVYFSPNTHLLGEAVALHAIGRLFPAFPESADWERRGAEVVQAQLALQVLPDGSHFEQSSYYHVYALDFFLFFYLLAGRPANFVPTLTRMAEYLHWLLGSARRIAFFGDDDGGRFFHPYGERDQFGRATLTACGLVLQREEWIGNVTEVAECAAWWMGAHCLGRARGRISAPSGNRLFADSGSAFLQSGDMYLQMDCGPFGDGGAGHSHADTLSVVLWLSGERVFVDPGTYTYMADPGERRWFRGSAAHNTIHIDGLDQGRQAGPFRWASKPEVTLDRWSPTQDGGSIEAACRYEGFTHRRRVLLEAGRLLVLDEIEGGAGEHTVEQIWQLGPAASKVNLTFSVPVTRSASRFSPAYGAQVAGEALTARVAGRLPIRIGMSLESAGSGLIKIDERCGEAVMQAW